MDILSQIGTYTLSTTTFEITSDMGINSIAVKKVSGTVTILGDLTTIGLQNTAQDISDSIQLTSVNPLNGVIIDASAGVASLLIIK